MFRRFLTALILIGALVSLASCKKPAGAPAAQTQAPAKDPNESLARWDKAEVRMQVMADGKDFGIMEMKNGNVRTEMSDERFGKRIDIGLRADRKFIILDVDKKEAEVYDFAGPSGFMKGISSSFDRKKAERHWTKSVYGETWKSTAPDGSETTQIWLDGPGGLPSKFVVDYGDMKTTMEYKYLKVGGIPDSDFEIPKGYKVTKKELPKPPTGR